MSDSQEFSDVPKKTKTILQTCNMVINSKWYRKGSKFLDYGSAKKHVCRHWKRKIPRKNTDNKYMVGGRGERTHNKTYHQIGENDPWMFVIICTQHEVEFWLNAVRIFLEGTNTLIILHDCKASKDVKGLTGQLVNIGFSARHIIISVWLLTQKITSITPSFRENVVAIVLFYTPLAKTTKAIFDDYAGELSHDEYKGLISKLKERKFSTLVFSPRHPYGVKTFFN